MTKQELQIQKAQTESYNALVGLKAQIQNLYALESEGTLWAKKAQEERKPYLKSARDATTIERSERTTINAKIAKIVHPYMVDADKASEESVKKAIAARAGQKAQKREIFVVLATDIIKSAVPI